MSMSAHTLLVHRSESLSWTFQSGLLDCRVTAVLLIKSRFRSGRQFQTFHNVFTPARTPISNLGVLAAPHLCRTPVSPRVQRVRVQFNPKSSDSLYFPDSKQQKELWLVF